MEESLVSSHETSKTSSSVQSIDKYSSSKQKRRVLPRTNQALYQQVEPSYYFENDFRKVRPYYFEFQVYTKARWIGRTICDVMLEDFRDRPMEYYEEAIKQGLITINAKPCKVDQILCNSDLVSHRVHRHEPPVLGDEIAVLFRSDKILVVNKPASMPVHATGRYRFNSLVEILKRKLQITTLGAINRLDRLTSGVCMLTIDGKSKSMHEEMENRCFHKQYIARVRGDFPSGEIECNEPLRLLEHKLGVVVTDDILGKESRTKFSFIKKVGEDSLVRCYPFTGRTHQIRVHLQCLGYPIANDFIYNHQCWQNSDMLIEEKLQTLATVQRKREGFDRHTQDFQSTNNASGLSEHSSLCLDCIEEVPDPPKHNLFIYLHAYQYTSSAGTFTAPFPDWAEE